MDLTTLYVNIDDFMQQFNQDIQPKRLSNTTKKRRRRASQMSISEIITLLVYFQYSHYRDFKNYYNQYVCVTLRSEFSTLLSYKRFVALIPRALVPLAQYLMRIGASKDDIHFIDSTALAVCHPKRIQSHKVFNGLAELGRSSKGWFLGFKLHVVCNTRGEIVRCCLTRGNVDDRRPVHKLTQALAGRLFGDKGYISQALFESLFERGLQVMTSVRANMKNKFMPLADKLLLRKRTLIESVIGQLKQVFQLEHTRHRSPINGFVHMLSALVAYMHYPKKASLTRVQRRQLGSNVA